VIAALAALLAGAAADAHAQPAVPAGTWLVSAAAGLGFDDDADAEQDVSLTVAGAAGLAITAHLAVEAELAHLFDLAINDPDVAPSLTTAHGSLLYLFSSELQAAPYLAAGLGVGHYSLDAGDAGESITRTATGFNLGGGVILVHRSDVWLRADLRYFKHDQDVPSAWRMVVAVTLYGSP
jgi:hypothetical protein